MINFEAFFRDFSEQRDLIFGGLINSLQLFVAISITGFLAGLVVLLFRIHPNRFCSRFAEAYVSFFVGTPLVILLFLAYYGLPQWNISLSSFSVALLGFTLNVGAYNAYYLYGAYQSISREELEASAAQGLTEFQTFASIILPQTLRLGIPPLVNQVIRNLKDTSLVFLIQYVEFFARIQELAASNFRFFEAYLFTCLVYLGLVSVLVLAGRWLERRAAIPGLTS